MEHYDALIRANGDLDYEELKEEMISRFSDDKIDIVIRSRISNRRLKPTESVSAFFNALRRDANKIDMSDEAFLFAFIHGLPQSMMKQVVLQNPANPNEALSIAKTLEQLDDMTSETGLEALKRIKKEAKIAATYSQSQTPNQIENQELKEMLSEIAKSLKNLQAATENNNAVNAAYANALGRERWRQNGPNHQPKRGLCYRCHQEGHFARECPAPAPVRQSIQRSAKPEPKPRV